MYNFYFRAFVATRGQEPEIKISELERMGCEVQWAPRAPYRLS